MIFGVYESLVSGWPVPVFAGASGGYRERYGSDATCRHTEQAGQRFDKSQAERPAKAGQAGTGE
ncbi:hypothetical protein D9M71_671830 [compost metagenome]